MKKIAKVAVGLTLAVSLTAGVAALAGCSGTPDKTGEAYGLSHTGGYVSCAKIVMNGDKVKDLTLNEICLPTYVKAADTVAETDKAGDYYKTVSYANVTLTYDVDAADYMVNGTAFKTYLQTEANAKAYYEAVMSNSVSVTVGDAQKTDVMTKAALSKDENGYWTRTDKDGASYSRWKMNRDATIAYVKQYGVSKLLDLALSTDGADKKEDKDVTYWTDGTVVTDATWSDLNSDTTGKNYYSYAQLIVKASEAAK